MRYKVDRRRVVHEIIDDEAILIRLDTGFYYSLDGTGSEIWEALVAGCTPDGITELLRMRYAAPPDEIEAAVAALVEELRAEELLDVALDASANGAVVGTLGDSGDPTHPRAKFEAPVLHRYTDMADFMLVDPIHEVEESGWPNRTPAP
jgi:hypothetical protein